jgi:hypothetical protein
MTEPSKPASWWQTLPGILTGVAAVVTAVSGLVGLLFQQGVLGRRAEPAAPVAVQAKAQTAPASVPLAAPVAPPPPAGKPWAEAVAVITLRGGQATRVPAATFRHCISVGDDLTLDSGQAVPFEKMRGFDVTRADAPGTAGGKTSLVIHLRDGSELKGTMDANCDLFGTNDLGRFSTTFDKLQGVRFER